MTRDLKAAYRSDEPLTLEERAEAQREIVAEYREQWKAYGGLQWPARHGEARMSSLGRWIALLIIGVVAVALTAHLVTESARCTKAGGAYVRVLAGYSCIGATK